MYGLERVRYGLILFELYLCNLLWGAKIQLNSGLADMFALSIIGSMFNGGSFGSPSPSADFLKQKLEEDENKENEQVFAIPVK